MPGWMHLASLFTLVVANPVASSKHRFPKSPLACGVEHKSVCNQPVYGGLRLHGASTDAGLLQVFHNGTWGTVCAEGAAARTAAGVACRQLGFGVASGTFGMLANTDEPSCLLSVVCTGHENKLIECNHSGHGSVSSRSSPLGIRCFACMGETCKVYAVPVVLKGHFLNASQLVAAFYNASANSESIDHALRLECSLHWTGNTMITCNVYTFADASAGNHGERQDNMDGVDVTNHANVLQGLPDPFREEIALRSYVYGKKLLKEYSMRRATLIKYLKSHPSDAHLLRALVKSGALQWNDAGILSRPLLKVLNSSSREMGLIRQLYLSPRVQMVSDLDARVGDLRAVRDVSSLDAAAAQIAEALHGDGLAEISDFGLDISALNASIDAAFAQIDPAFTSVASNGASMTTRITLPALAPLIANSTINAAVRAYLGPDAVLDGYKTVRLAGSATGSENIAGLWHNDRAGNRLKMFIRLHDVDPRPQAGHHPTQIAAGSHQLLYFSFEGYEHSRLRDDFIYSEHTVRSLGGRMGSGFIFDTNTLHRAVPEGILGRTTIVLEFHSAAKCPIIQTLDLPIPCPSGDQHLLSTTERLLATSAEQDPPSASAPVKHHAPGTGIGAAGAGSQCVTWTPEPEIDQLVMVAKEGQDMAVVQPSSGGSRFLQAWGNSSAELHALTVQPGCRIRWRFYSFDVWPIDGNTLWLDSPSGRDGICLLDGILGSVPFGGRNAGTCLVPGTEHAAAGNFEMLLAFPAGEQDKAAAGESEARAAEEKEHRQIHGRVVHLRELVQHYLSTSDASMLQQATGTSLDELVARLVAAAAEPVTLLRGTPHLIDAVLSAERFVPHELNTVGLHLLRVLLAERMSDKRRSLASSPTLAATHQEQWVRDGFLRLDYDEYKTTRDTGNEKLNEILRMASASSLPQKDIEFVMREVRHVAGDPQYALHQDTFHSVVKLWVYPRNLTRANGPLHFVRGSHRVSAGKLAWLYERTKANDLEVIREPSLRFDPLWQIGAKLADSLAAFALEPALPVLPLPNARQTLIVADTSGLHCRGEASLGLSRHALRPAGGENDGGVQRLNPFRTMTEWAV